MKTSIITIGTEILIGQIIDTNSAWLGKKLNEQGAEVLRILSVNDDMEQMISAFEMTSQDSDLILVTGGLGPTKDDFTKKAISQFLNLEMYFDQSTYDKITDYFKKRNYPLSSMHKEQCYMPKTALLLENKLGTAPGMLFEKDACTIISMPGVPFEMKYIFNHHIVPFVKKKQTNNLYHRTIHTCGRGESMIADDIEPIIQETPDYISFAYLPSKASVRIRISGKHPNKEVLQNEIDQVTQKISKHLSSIVFGFDDTNLVKALQKIMINNGLTISTAESCTGGNIAHHITLNPGSSAYFQGSAVAYDNRIKEKVLGVNPETLKNEGAVSIATTEQMVKGCLDLFNTDIAIAVSGIAGPGGGTEEKPVGTVCISVGNRKRIESKKLLIKKDRKINIEYSTTYAFILLRKFLLGDNSINFAQN